jgi:hypothetical protein
MNKYQQPIREVTEIQSLGVTNAKDSHMQSARITLEGTSRKDISQHISEVTEIRSIGVPTQYGWYPPDIKSGDRTQIDDGGTRLRSHIARKQRYKILQEEWRKKCTMTLERYKKEGCGKEGCGKEGCGRTKSDHIPTFDEGAQLPSRRTKTGCMPTFGWSPRYLDDDGEAKLQSQKDISDSMYSPCMIVLTLHISQIQIDHIMFSTCMSEMMEMQHIGVTDTRKRKVWDSKEPNQPTAEEQSSEATRISTRRWKKGTLEPKRSFDSQHDDGGTELQNQKDHDITNIYYCNAHMSMQSIYIHISWLESWKIPQILEDIGHLEHQILQHYLDQQIDTRKITMEYITGLTSSLTYQLHQMITSETMDIKTQQILLHISAIWETSRYHPTLTAEERSSRVKLSCQDIQPNIGLVFHIHPFAPTENSSRNVDMRPDFENINEY